MEYSKNLGLALPNDNDPLEVSRLSENFEKLDEAIAGGDEGDAGAIAKGLKIGDIVYSARNLEQETGGKLIACDQRTVVGNQELFSHSNMQIRLPPPVEMNHLKNVLYIGIAQNSIGGVYLNGQSHNGYIYTLSGSAITKLSADKLLDGEPETVGALSTPNIAAIYIKYPNLIAIHSAVSGTTKGWEKMDLRTGSVTYYAAEILLPGTSEFYYGLSWAEIGGRLQIYLNNLYSSFPAVIVFNEDFSEASVMPRASGSFGSIFPLHNNLHTFQIPTIEHNGMTLCLGVPPYSTGGTSITSSTLYLCRMDIGGELEILQTYTPKDFGSTYSFLLDMDKYITISKEEDNIIIGISMRYGYSHGGGRCGRCCVTGMGTLSAGCSAVCCTGCWKSRGGGTPTGP